MREPLISMADIPSEGTVTADLLGREVLVMMQNGKPRAFLNVSSTSPPWWTPYGASPTARR